MTINTTLGEILRNGNDWDNFCEKEGYSIYCVNEGGGDMEINLTEEQAIEYGLISIKKTENKKLNPIQ